MTLLAGHLLVCTLGLTLLALLAFAVVRLCRHDPVQAYRFLVIILVLALALPFAQILVQGRFADMLVEKEPAHAASAAPQAWLAPTTLPSDPDPLWVVDSYASYDEAAGQRALLAAIGLAETTPPAEPGIESEELFSMTLEEPVPAADQPWVHRLARDIAPWTILWFLGLAGMTMLLARRLRLTRRLVEESLLVQDGPVYSAFAKLAREYGLERRVSLRASVQVSGPCCAGCRSAVLIVPLRDAEAPPSPALIWGMRHELTHLRRGDGLTLALQNVLTALFWFHPAVWWFSSQVDRLRELSCDQLVVLHTGRRKSYALALVDYARPLAAQGAPAGLVPWFGSKSQLKRRIEMLALSTTRPSTLRRGLQALGILTVLTLLLGGQVLAAGVWLPQEEDPAVAPEPVAPEEPTEIPAPPKVEEEPIVFIEDLPAPAAPATDLAACPDRIGVVLKHPSAQVCAPYGVDPDHALEVVSVEAGYPAERAGIRPGDLLIGFGDDTAFTHDALLDRIKKNRGGNLRLEVGRGGKVRTVLIDLATPVSPAGPPDPESIGRRRAENRQAVERRKESIERRREALEERIARLEEKIEQERERLEESVEREQERREALMERTLEKIEENMERAQEKMESHREQIEEKMESLEDIQSEEARRQARRELEKALRKLDEAMRKNRAKLEQKARSLQQRYEQELKKHRRNAEQTARQLELHARAERRAIQQEARRLDEEARELEALARQRVHARPPQPPRTPMFGALPTLEDVFEQRRADKGAKDSSRRRAATLERLESELRRHLDKKLPKAAKRGGGLELDGLIRRALETIGNDGDIHLDLHPTIQGNTIYIIVNPHVDAGALERKLRAPKARRKPAPHRKSKGRRKGKNPAPKLTYQGHLIRAVAEAAADMGPVQVPLAQVDGPVRDVLQSLLDRIDRLEKRMSRMEEGLRP
ncbi:MAG TPA: PDZ domain-containing protein [Planctomycetes bacterium]|nr:PDZ domain-containing protein [Planctomycetota bacterium]